MNNIHLTSYERISRSLLRTKQKSKPFCWFDPDQKRLLVGMDSLHRTAQARRWRLFWRIKMVRPK